MKEQIKEFLIVFFVLSAIVLGIGLGKYLERFNLTPEDQTERVNQCMSINKIPSLEIRGSRLYAVTCK